MSFNRTVLERLRNPDPPGQRRSKASPDEVMDSILRNLTCVLNTCQGNTLIDDRYGLPHLSTIRSTMPISVTPFETSIRTTIERHEPRVSNVRVRHVFDESGQVSLRFEISGIVKDEEGRMQIRFETYADEDGRMQVR